MSGLVTRSVLLEYLRRLARSYADAGTVYLIGETSQVYESCRSWTARIELTSSASDPDRFEAARTEATAEMDVQVIDEFPGDLVPLPDGYQERSRPAAFFGALEVRHFDAYAAAFRFMARGDEPDYHLVLTYVKQGWIDLDEMDERLQTLLPRFSMETIQQDPAEFRRKYKGLRQMARSIGPGTIHRHTPV